MGGFFSIRPWSCRVTAAAFSLHRIWTRRISSVCSFSPFGRISPLSTPLPTPFPADSSRLTSDTFSRPGRERSPPTKASSPSEPNLLLSLSNRESPFQFSPLESPASSSDPTVPFPRPLTCQSSFLPRSSFSSKRCWPCFAVSASVLSSFPKVVDFSLSEAAE